MKKLVKIVVLTILLILPFSLKAEVTLKERNESNNYGVNKKWTIDESNINNVKNTKYVNVEDKIYDFSEVLTEEERENLKKLINDYIEKTNMDMVILIDSVPYVVDSVNEDYAVDFYDYNDFGLDFENYSGVILFRNTYSSNPYFNVYTFGNAQLYYSYQRCENMLDNIYYDLKGHNYFNGFSTFIEDFDYYYDEGKPSELKDYYIDDMGYLKKKYRAPWLVAIIVSSLTTIIVLSIMYNKNRMVKKDSRASEYLNRESIKFTKRNKSLMSSHTTHYTRSSSSSGGGGGGFSSSGGSSGGGHSGGGGRHG